MDESLDALNPVLVESSDSSDTLLDPDSDCFGGLLEEELQCPLEFNHWHW
jgi:hypothetical protein